MAGPWERYQKTAAAAGPWQAYQQVTPTQEEPTEPYTPPDPTDRMSNSEKFFAGMGKSAVDTYRGIKQAGTDSMFRSAMQGATALDSVGMHGAGDWVARNVGAPIYDELQDQQSAIDEAKRTDEALMGTKAGIGGNVAGYISQIVIPGTWLRGTQFARFALPATVAGNSAQGAVLGGLQPVASGESRAGNAALGGVFGAGGSVLAKILGKGAAAGVSGLRKLLSGGQKLSREERKAADILIQESGGLPALMRQAPSSVPGVVRTLGEETLDPKVMALENTMRAQHRGTFEPIDVQNNAARVTALRGIAGDDAAMSAADSARFAGTNQLRKQAFEEGAQAETEAQKRGFSFKGNVDDLGAQIDTMIGEQAGRPAVQAAMRDVRSALGDAPATVEGLYRVRKTVDDLLAGKAGADKAYARAASQELMQIKGMLDDTITSIAPSFGDYIGAYRELSKPINRMQIGQRLLDKGSSAVPDVAGMEQILPGRFSQVATDLDSVAQKATKFNKAKAGDYLTEADFKAIAGIQDDMQRMFARQKSATVGSQTNERGAIAERLRDAALSKIPLGLGNLIKAAESEGNKAVQAKLAYLVANPDEARRVLAALPPEKRNIVARELIRISSQASGAVGSSSGATYEAQRPLEIDIVGGTPISVDEARRQYGP